MATEHEEPLWRGLDIAAGIRIGDQKRQAELATLEEQAERGDTTAQVILSHVKAYLENAEISSTGSYLRE